MTKFSQIIGYPTGDYSIGWYVHLPFCTTKCGYCDFYSVPTRTDWIPDLVRAVIREMERRDPGRPVRSVFVGGGTPTVLPAEPLRAILAAITERLRAHQRSGGEFTVEANPSSADELKLDLLRECGVNRVSFGAQSFDRRELAVLERLHDPRHIDEAVRLARAVGFDNINLDLIYGVPGQTLDSWISSLRKAIDLGPDHLACYSLMYEDGTALTKRLRQGQIQPCEDDLVAEMFEAAFDLLTAAGYEQYEISNFARPGRRCQHNLIYWRNEEYLGVGPSAVSYLDGRRRKNAADVSRYIRVWTAANGDPESLIVEDEQLAAEPRARETAIQMLRLSDGIDIAAFLTETGFDPMTLFAEALDRHVAAGLLAVDARSIRLTQSGMMLANRVMVDFL
jgi:oxygen-independent coproporphyrinogen-3 oxidase